MAKRASNATTSRLADETKGITAIRSYHASGLRLLARAKKEQCSLEDAADALALSLRLKQDAARKAARFAELFNEEELEWLCKMWSSKAITPLSVNHIRAVLFKLNQSKRKKLLERAASNGWTAQQLRDEARRLKGSEVHPGGPEIKRPKSLSDALEQIIRRGDEWLKRYNTIWSEDADWATPSEASKSIALSARLNDACRQLDRLSEASRELKVRLRKIDRTISKV